MMIWSVLSFPRSRRFRGQHFETAGRYELEFEASGVRFRLSMQYREEEDGVPSTELLDFRLVEGHDWTIPITSEITRLDSR